MTDSSQPGFDPAMPQRPARPEQPGSEPAAPPPAGAPPAFPPPSFPPPTTQPATQPPATPQQPPAAPPVTPQAPPAYAPPAQPAAFPPPAAQAPTAQPFQQPGVGGGGQPPANPPNYGGGGGPVEPDSGGGGRGIWLALGGLVGALILGVGAFVVLDGDGDDDPAGSVIAGEDTTNTGVAEDSTTTTEETSTTEEVDPLTTDLIATSVVQIFPASNGVPVCQGSGTIVTNDGLIVTNAHVVESFGACAYDSLQIAITSSADTAPEVRYLGEVYALDQALDLAVVGVAYDLEGNPITVSDLAPITIGDSDNVGLGDTIRILGYPSIGGDTITFTSGSVSGFTAEAGIADRAFIKTDATISGGNSGGLAVNDAFEMIGVPTQASGGANLDIADCRVVTDTNGDGVVDDLDSCIPIGGFINGIRPVNLVSELISEASAREPVVQSAPPVVGAVAGDFYNITMTSAIADDDSAVDDLKFIAAGTEQVCATFDFEAMVDGTSWDAIWSIDGEFIEGFSILESEWFGGADGTDWWVCATGDVDGLPEGTYELQLYINDEFNSSNTIRVGGPGLVTITVVNDTPSVVCYLQVAPNVSNGWGPDDLGAEEILEPGDEATIELPPDVYDFSMQDCDYNQGSEFYEVNIVGGEQILLSGN